MSQEVIIKKSENGFYALIPHLGVCVHKPQLEESYLAALESAQTVEKSFTSLKMQHLLPQSRDHLVFRLNNKKTLKIYFITLFVILASISLVGLTIKKSIDRATYSLDQSLFKNDPERVEKNREKFRALLEKYKPLIEEWKKATKE